jgi:ferredoxin-nitrite reductase
MRSKGHKRSGQPSAVNRDYTNLPRKVNVTITGCRDNCTHPETQDIALIPAIRQTSEGKVAGSNVLAGGRPSSN